MYADNAIVNLPLAQRGNIDAQIDAYKKTLAKTESFQKMRCGNTVLCKANLPRVFANRTQAEANALRVGGEAYQSRLSNRFLVRLCS